MENLTIKMDSLVAETHYHEYRDSVRKSRERREVERRARAAKLGKQLYEIRIEKTQLEKEDEMLKEAYWALSKYETVINIHDAIGRTGLNAQKLPALAICRADAQRCFLNTSNREPGVVAFGTQRNFNRPPADTVVKVRVPTEFWQTLDDWTGRHKLGLPQLNRVGAHVPPVPPAHRPENLKDYFILWEAVWDNTAPIDPMLLKKLNDNFYVVVAQWDLTELERSVLGQRPVG